MTATNPKTATCKICKQTLPVYLFTADSRMKNGRLNQCKPCAVGQSKVFSHCARCIDRDPEACRRCKRPQDERPPQTRTARTKAVRFFKDPAHCTTCIDAGIACWADCDYPDHYRLPEYRRTQPNEGE